MKEKSYQPLGDLSVNWVLMVWDTNICSCVSTVWTRPILVETTNILAWINKKIHIFVRGTMSFRKVVSFYFYRTLDF